MMSAQPQSAGTLSRWDDARGFGFIAPQEGGEAVFVHIRDCRSLQSRPQVGDRLLFRRVSGKDGRMRAIDIVPAGMTRARQARTGHSVSVSFGRVWPALLFMAWVLAATVAGYLLLPVLLLYVLLGLLTFGIYALDKSAARRGRWRISESTLHGLSLAGGWPGALLAQQMLRHKSSKREFRRVFWVTVVVNGLALGWLLTAEGQSLQRLVQQTCVQALAEWRPDDQGRTWIRWSVQPLR